MTRIWALLGAMTTVLALVVAVPAPAGASGVNMPTPGGGGAAQPKRTPLSVVKHDSRIPTYDYYVLTFDRRATYLIGHKTRMVSTVAELLGRVLPRPHVKAISAVVSVVSNFVRDLAKDAERAKKCLAGRVYVQRRKFLNPPGPDALITKVYATRSRCHGSYAHG